MYYAVLYCIVLYCIVYCINCIDCILYCIVLYCIVLYIVLVVLVVLIVYCIVYCILYIVQCALYIVYCRFYIVLYCITLYYIPYVMYHILHLITGSRDHIDIRTLQTLVSGIPLVLGLASQNVGSSSSCGLGGPWFQGISWRFIAQTRSRGIFQDCVGQLGCISKVRAAGMH